MSIRCKPNTLPRAVAIVWSGGSPAQQNTEVSSPPRGRRRCIVIWVTSARLEKAAIEGRVAACHRFLHLALPPACRWPTLGTGGAGHVADDRLRMKTVVGVERCDGQRHPLPLSRRRTPTTNAAPYIRRLDWRSAVARDWADRFASTHAGRALSLHEYLHPTALRSSSTPSVKPVAMGGSSVGRGHLRRV